MHIHTEIYIYTVYIYIYTFIYRSPMYRHRHWNNNTNNNDNNNNKGSGMFREKRCRRTATARDFNQMLVGTDINQGSYYRKPSFVQVVRKDWQTSRLIEVQCLQLDLGLRWLYKPTRTSSCRNSLGLMGIRSPPIMLLLKFEQVFSL